jgi:predicted N-acyltransferase
MPAEAAARPQAPASVRVRIVDRVAHLPPADWAKVRNVDRSVFMDPGFLSAVERAFPLTGCRHAIVYDDAGRPCAWASLCVFTVDLATLAGPVTRAAVDRLRAVVQRFGHVRVVFVGLPVSLGQSHLAISEDADVEAVLDALDHACERIAALEGAWLIVWKEFDDAGTARIEPLRARGYERGASPPMHELAARFADFGEYRAALTAHYRADVRRSERKFQASGLRAVHLRDAWTIAQVYTPEVHGLYEAVVARSAVKLERLPVEFFHELLRQFPGSVTLTAIYEADRVVAFNWGLLDGRLYRFLFCGMDYDRRGADLYFNLMYHQLDDAFRLRPEQIEVGQTADHFKARLGCRASPRYVYVKPRHRLARAVLRGGFPLLFPQRPLPPSHAVFRDSPRAGDLPRPLSPTK